MRLTYPRIYTVDFSMPVLPEQRSTTVLSFSNCPEPFRTRPWTIECTHTRYRGDLQILLLARWGAMDMSTSAPSRGACVTMNVLDGRPAAATLLPDWGDPESCVYITHTFNIQGIPSSFSVRVQVDMKQGSAAVLPLQVSTVITGKSELQKRGSAVLTSVFPD